MAILTCFLLRKEFGNTEYTFHRSSVLSLLYVNIRFKKAGDRFLAITDIKYATIKLFKFRLFMGNKTSSSVKGEKSCQTIITFLLQLTYRQLA